MFAMVIGSIGLLKWVVAIIIFDSPRGAPGGMILLLLEQLAPLALVSDHSYRPVRSQAFAKLCRLLTLRSASLKYRLAIHARSPLT
jgi:hypothetical protein